MSLPLSEADIQRQILDYLVAHRVFHWRNNTGAFKGEYKGKERFVRYGVPGMPDIVCVIKGRFIGIEVKRYGEDQSRAQKEFEVSLEKAGGVYLLVDAVEQVAAWLESPPKEIR